MTDAQPEGLTHPSNAGTLPGDGDWELPVALNIPLYGVTKAGTWRVNPPGPDGRLTVELVDRRWGAGQAEVNEAIEKLNRRKRPVG